MIGRFCRLHHVELRQMPDFYLWCPEGHPGRHPICHEHELEFERCIDHLPQTCRRGHSCSWSDSALATRAWRCWCGELRSGLQWSPNETFEVRVLGSERLLETVMSDGAVIEAGGEAVCGKVPLGGHRE